MPPRSREDAVPTGKQYLGYQHMAPLGQLLAPACDYPALLGQARSSPYSAVLFAVKDHTKKIAVPRIEPVEEKHPKNSLYLNVHELELKQMLSEKQNKYFRKHSACVFMHPKSKQSTLLSFLGAMY